MHDGRGWRQVSVLWKLIVTWHLSGHESKLYSKLPEKISNEIDFVEILVSHATKKINKYSLLCWPLNSPLNYS